MTRATRIGIFALVLPLVVCWQLPASGAITSTATYYLNQSNTYADGINYGNVVIEASTDDGTVKFTVSAETSPYSSIGSNFGFQTFGFNPDLLAGTTYTFAGPSGWNLVNAPTQDGFGSYLENTAGGGNSRVNPLVFTLTLSNFAEAVATNFASTNDGAAQYFFAGHVAGFYDEIGSTEDKSHFIAGSTTEKPPDGVVTPTPEPTSLAIWCLGMVAAGIGARRMRKRK